MKLFDYIKVMFGSEANWQKLSNYDKSKNAFMTNRFMSAKFPKQANLFNALRTDPVGAADCWRMIGRRFNRVPGFIYTKTKQAKKVKPWQPDPAVYDFYLKVNEIGHREFQEALKFNPKILKKSFKTLEKQMKNDTK